MRNMQELQRKKVCSKFKHHMLAKYKADNYNDSKHLMRDFPEVQVILKAYEEQERLRKLKEKEQDEKNRLIVPEIPKVNFSVDYYDDDD